MVIMSENKELNQRLMESIENSDAQVVKELIRQGANLNIQYEEWNNKTPLIRSIEKGNDEIINLLLDNGAIVNTQVLREEKFFETTALHEAVFRGKYDIVKKLIEKGAKINAKSYGNTVLQYAIKKGYNDIAVLLIENGANYNIEGYEFVDGRMQKGVTAFELAKQEGNGEILEAITNKEKEKKQKREEKRNKHIEKLEAKLQNDVELRHKFSDKSIEAYVDLKMGVVVDLKLLKKDELNDLLELYNYNKKKTMQEPNHTEITQTEMDAQLEAKKPVYIRALSRVTHNDFREHNETGAEWEIRKLLRNKGEETLSNIESTKTGKNYQCFSMVNYGKIIPYNNGVGIGAFQEDIKKIHLASEVDMSSLHHKGSDLISVDNKYYAHSHPFPVYARRLPFLPLPSQRRCSS